VLKHKPLISVLMPVYNCELYIDEAIESILNQTYTNFEFLIIDDLSTDTTVSRIKNYTDPRIKLIEKPLNSGIASSLNLGFKIAKGDYLARMDGDDISLPERFAKQIAFLENNPDVIVCGSFYTIIGTQKSIPVPEKHEDIKVASLRNNCMVHPSLMLRKKAVDELSICYDDTKEPVEDFDLWVRLFTKGKFHNLQEVLLHYRIHSHQVSTFNREKQKKGASKVRFELLNQLPFEKTEQESIALQKMLLNDDSLHYNHIVLFQKIKNKLLKANENHFFGAKKFQEFLIHLEFNSVKNYFLNRKQYNPMNYLQYLKIKYSIAVKLKSKDEFKLMAKSFLFYSIK
jgi:glycosyltransferase involved in cell wall biosynthesis